MENKLQTLTLPRRIISGSGSVHKIVEIAVEQHASRVCMLADQTVYENNGLKILKQHLEEKNIPTTVITSIKTEPDFEMVQQMLEDEQLLQTDLFIAIGGGSVIDTAKILSACCTNPPFQHNLHDASLIKEPAAYLIAVPTTAGTGAEATPNAILLDKAQNLKIGIVSNLMVAQTVLLDCDLTKTLPLKIAVTTGLDAMAHALESFISTKSNCFSDLFGLKAMQLVFENLAKACIHNDVYARENMLLASFYAGVCLSSSSTCAVHAIAYPLSGYFHVPHGMSISMLLLPVMEKLSQACTSKFSDIYITCFKTSLGSEEENAGEFMHQLKKLAEFSGVISPMREYGVQEKDLSKMAASAKEIKRLFDNTPTSLSEEDLVEIYRTIL